MKSLLAIRHCRGPEQKKHAGPELDEFDWLLQSQVRLDGLRHWDSDGFYSVSHWLVAAKNGFQTAMRPYHEPELSTPFCKLR